MFISKKILAFLILLIPGFMAPLTAQIHVAITSFENQTDEILLDGWQRNLPDYLSVELGASQNLILLERNRLKEIFAEMHLALSGFVQNPTLAEKIGKLAGADVILSGVITKVGQNYVILAHITRVKTGEVMVEKVEAPDNKHFAQMAHLLGNNIRFRLTGEGKYQQKVSLKRYPTAYFLLGALVSGMTAGLLEKNAQNAYDDYHAATSLKDFDRYYDKANRLNRLSDAFWGLAGISLVGATVSWLKNMKQKDLKAGSEKGLSINYQWDFYERGARFGFTIRF
ncbi:CsgG/HfaB family protein [Caldithrix abyssi]